MKEIKNKGARKLFDYHRELFHLAFKLGTDFSIKNLKLCSLLIDFYEGDFDKAKKFIATCIDKWNLIKRELSHLDLSYPTIPVLFSFRHTILNVLESKQRNNSVEYKNKNIKRKRDSSEISDRDAFLRI